MSKTNGKSSLNTFKDHLMSGISYALPVIIGGSLVVAIAKIIGMVGGFTDLSVFEESGGFFHYIYLLEQVGWTAIGLLNLVLGGYIAYSIAGKPGLAAGFVGGSLASSYNAGFIGAVLAGFIAGSLAKWVKNTIKIKGSGSAAVPLIISPLITVGGVAIVMIALKFPLSWINVTLLNWITSMIETGTNKIILAAILGGMIAFDMGGPVNKAAWMAGNALMMSGVYMPAIMVNCAICIPPLGYGLATVLKKKNFSEEFRESGKGALIMGFIGITEGAIPFTLYKPSRLIPLNVLGGIVGTVVAVALGVYDIMPPIGGVYGFFTLGNGWAYLVGILVGSLVIAIGTNLLVDFTDAGNEDTSDSNSGNEVIEEEIVINFD